MKYKMVCIDVDGTLLNEKHQVSEISKIALKKAYDAGVHIVINTGRIYIDAQKYSDLIGVKSPVIAANGAVAKDKITGEEIYKSFIKEEDAIKIIDICKKNKVKIMAFANDTVYYQGFIYGLVQIILKFKKIVYEKINYKRVPSWKNWQKVIEEEKNNIVKIEFVLLSEDRLLNIKKELERIEGIIITRSSKYNMEITDLNASKGKAMQALGEYYNIDKEEIIAIGDSDNDLSMIEYAGLGVAMGNGMNSVKEKADFITDSNKNEGVAKVIEKYILNEES